MKRAYAKQHAPHKPRSAQPRVPSRAPGHVIQLSLDRDELLGLMQDSLESLALKLGMLVATSLLEDEVTRLCGRRYERQPSPLAPLEPPAARSNSPWIAMSCSD